MKATTPEPGIRQVLAPNGSPMTYHGTNSYILGEGRVAIIDPGPNDPAHLQALLDALQPGEVVSHILVTHSHVDHSAGVTNLAQATGAPVYAFGDTQAGSKPVLADIGGGEGLDHTFAPDEIVPDGGWIEGEDWRVQALWTPGHLGNHLCFAWGNVVFSGDHVMDWATSMVSPPDGNLNDFMASLQKLMGRRDRVFYPGHGNPVIDPEARVRNLFDHRKGREAQILDALQDGPADAATLTRRIYTDVDAYLLPAAQRNVIAHLLALVEGGRVVSQGPVSASAVFALTEGG
ncbi:metallo-beta-lactamase [Actibacterium mucosum KCTC 23349]|uniref:Metallo-beta-lactamase n=1 Tax=Actibacterium mucosum KCTC 23349 TaxID=1454373 RepID=A0A037ZID2_9RHOB|nr:metallo-beta-lactamase [Actibacterium mucosum KCTC 23349]